MVRVALGAAVVLGVLALAGLGVASLVSDPPPSVASTPTRTAEGDTYPIVSDGESLTVSSSQFVTLVQICAALQNGHLPFGSETPIATPPIASQGSLISSSLTAGRSRNA
jgi:hypothetical protein